MQVRSQIQHARNPFLFSALIGGIFTLILGESAPLIAQEGFRPSPRQGAPRPRVEKRPIDRSKPNYQITERGANHQVWERVSMIADPSGEPLEHTSSFTQLQGGLNYWDGLADEWRKSEALIESTADGAIARKGQHQVHFERNLNTPGAITLIDPSGKSFESSVLGIAYVDETREEQVVIARVKDSLGRIVPPNRVVYPDAFDGILADVVMTYMEHGIEQDVVFRQDPGAPENYNLSGEARLVVLTEFLTAPALKEDSGIETGESERVGVKKDRDILDFGEMRMVSGVAFERSGNPGGASERVNSVNVEKSWHAKPTGSILAEGIDYQELREGFGKLESIANGGPTKKAPVIGAVGQVPTRIAASTKGSSARFPVESDQALLKDGVVLDYLLVNSSYTDLILKADITYHVTGAVVISNKLTIQGGTVVKYDAQNTSLIVQGSIDCETSEFNPAFFTSRDDDSVGEVISNSSGNPSNYFGEPQLRLESISGEHLQHLRFRWAVVGLTIKDGDANRIEHCQFLSCRTPISVKNAVGTYFGNLLIDGRGLGSLSAFHGNNSAIHAEHVTAMGVDDVLTNLAGLSLELRNSLLVDADSLGGYTVDPNLGVVEVDTASAGTPFDATGAGHFYLLNPSPLRDVGIDAIDPGLSYKLRTMTCSPPVPGGVGGIVGDVTWDKLVDPDLGSLDLGYHYARIDYAVQYCYVQPNSTLTMNPGVNIAIHAGGGNAANPFRAGSNSTFDFQGNAEERVTITHYTHVQEQPTRWTGASLAGGWGHTSYFIYLSPHQRNRRLQARFTDFISSTVHSRNNHIWAAGIYPQNLNDRQVFDLSRYGEYEWQYIDIGDSRFYGGQIGLAGVEDGLHEFRNCLFEGVRVVSIHGQQELNISNCLFNDTFLSVSQFSTIASQSAAEAAWASDPNNADYLLDAQRLTAALATLGAGVSYPLEPHQYTIRDNLLLNTTLSTSSVLLIDSLNNAYVGASTMVDRIVANSGGQTIEAGAIGLLSIPLGPGPFGNYYQDSNSPLKNAGSRPAPAAGLFHYATAWPNDVKEGASTVDIGLHYPSTIPGSGGN